MAKQPPNNKRSRIIATVSILFSLIGLSFVIIVIVFQVNIMVGGFSFPFGLIAWMLAHEIKSIKLAIPAAFVTFSFPIFIVVIIYLWPLW